MGWWRENVEKPVLNLASAIDDEIIQPVAHTVESIVEDPAKLALVAIAVVAPAYLPLASAVNTAAKGGDLGDVLESAGKVMLTQGVASYAGGLGDQIGAAAEYGTDIGSQQTAMLAAQNAGMGTAGDIFGNVAGNTAAAIVGGQDPLLALTSSGLNAGTSAVTSQIPGFSDLSPAAQRAVNNAVSAELTGKDPTQSLINSAINAGVAEARNQSFQSINENAAINPYLQTGVGTGALPEPTETPLPAVSPLTTVGMTPQETESTDWASIYAQPTTNPETGQTIVGGDTSEIPSQNFGDSATGALNSGTINVGPGGFTSGWQTSGSDRIMVQDDGTAIGINENGDQYSLNPDEVNKMIANGQLNTKESGYVAATGGTGNLPGGSGTTTTSTPTTTPTATTTSPLGGVATSTPTTSKTNPFGVLPLDSSPQMLTSTMPRSSVAKMAELQQLYKSLTPEMQSVLSDRGITPPTEASMPEMTQAASGGLISDETAKILASLNPKFTSSPNLLTSVAPQQHESRLGALKHLAQGPLRGSTLSNRMASGGLPHKYAEAAPDGHKPEFITGLTGYYAQGGGTGQSDDIPAMLHDGDWVCDADMVAALGDGSSKAGAEVLDKMLKQIPHRDGAAGSPVAAKIADGEFVFPAAFVTAIGGGSNKVGAERLNEMREKIRAHKRSAPTTKIPPKAKSPLDYLKMAKG